MKALVCGGGGFIGSHMVKRLKDEGYYVIAADLKDSPTYWDSVADEYLKYDLTYRNVWEALMNDNFDLDEIYQFAADMGGLGFIGTGENDFQIMNNSALVNMQCARALYHCYYINKSCNSRRSVPKLFFSSSSCVYPRKNQMDADAIVINEESAYPAECDNNYGWEKLFAERVYQTLFERFGIEIRIARLHNTYGPYETYKGGREKAPAASCLKVLNAVNGSPVDVWGTGKQIRTFMYVDDCIEGIRRLMNAPYYGMPLNLGSTEKVTADQLVSIAAVIAGKQVEINHIPDDPTKPMGVPYRTSDNRKLIDHLGWSPKTPIVTGLRNMYMWIQEQERYENETE